MSPTFRGLLDTSVVIGRLDIPADDLPPEAAISTLTLAELATGPHAANDAMQRAARQERLQRAEAEFYSLPFDVDAARAYGRIYAAVRMIGRQPRGRIVDLQIAAVALANDLPLYTRNPDDFRGLDGLVVVVPV